MDQITLVASQIDAGQRLAERVAQDGFTVTAAGWLQESEAGLWYLYIASSLVGEEGGTRKAYGHVNAILRRMPQPFGIDPFEIKMIGNKNPIAKEMAAIRDRSAGKGPVWFRGHRLGELAIEGAYLYPPITAPSLSDASSDRA